MGRFFAIASIFTWLSMVTASSYGGNSARSKTRSSSAAYKQQMQFLRVVDRYSWKPASSSHRLSLSLSATTSSTHSGENERNIEFTREGIEEYARINNLELRNTGNPLFLKLEATPMGEEKPIGYLTAFIRPFPMGLLQLETIQVKNHRQYLGYRRQTWTIDGPGISFIMGSWALKWAEEKGCKRAELLAVKDSDQMHEILKRLYQGFGFRVVREVGDDSSSVQDRLVWGAVGTLMQLDIPHFMKEWTPKFRSLYAKSVRDTTASKKEEEETNQPDALSKE